MLRGAFGGNGVQEREHMFAGASLKLGGRFLWLRHTILRLRAAWESGGAETEARGGLGEA